ncbi:hypothetical protein FACS18949_07300 [Clostridia bacterium]|nr:hypothetical protein FACS18949_07300 [Clostridia bacterium]
MNNVYNTIFEVSLRVLMTLEAAPRDWLSADRIAAADFICTYGKDFGVTNDNLHGDNSYRYSEFALRRELVKEALKSLVARCLADVTATADGFAYTLSQDGGEYCAELSCGYADEYRELAQAVKTLIADMTERDIIALIHGRSLSSVQRRVD